MSGSGTSYYDALLSQSIRGTWLTNTIPESLTATPDGRGYKLAIDSVHSIVYPEANLGAPMGTGIYDEREPIYPSGLRKDGCSSQHLAQQGFIGLYKPAPR